jgi:Fe-S-cluster-containing hydrogenase component 2
MTTETCQTAGIEIADDFCSRCGICVAVCPFEAISKDVEQNKIILDVEKCRVCGLCVSACPLSAIDLVYYDVDSLTKKVQTEMAEKGAKTLVSILKIPLKTKISKTLYLFGCLVLVEFLQNSTLTTWLQV